MEEFNVQQKQFIQEYKATHHLENKSDEQIMLFIQKDMQTNGVVYSGFENLVNPQNKSAHTGQIFDNSTNRSDNMEGLAVEQGSATAVKEPEKEITTDENGNEVAVVKNGDEIVEATVTSTDPNGNKIETVVSYENGKPVKQIKKQNGNVSSVTKFTYNDSSEEIPFPFVTVETEDSRKNKVITTALETDKYGNVDQEDFIKRKTISQDGTETTVIIGASQIQEEKIKFDGKKVTTLYNGTNLADFDNHKLHRVAQETEENGVKRYVEYDGRGNTKTTVQNGESPALIAQKFKVKEQALMRLNPQKGKNAITQVGADILIPGEFNADSYPMRVRKSKAESLNKYSQFEARRLTKEINSGEVQNVKLAKSYNNVYEFAKDNLIKSGVKNPSNQQVNDEANKLILLNGKNIKLKAGQTVKVAKSLASDKSAQELTKYGFQATAENRIFFQKFNALNSQQKQNVLSAIQYCKSQKITNSSDIKAKILETLGINLFDSNKTVPMVADNNYGVMAYQKINNKPISIETFVKDHLKLNIKSEPGKTVLNRLSQVEQSQLNKISAKDFKAFNNKTLDGVASMLETVGVQIRTQAEMNVKNNTPRAKAEREKRAVRTAAAENIALAYDNAINVIKNYQGNQGWMNVGYYREKLGQLLDKVNPTDVATCFDALVKQLEKEKQFAVSRLKTASASESEFKQAFKSITGKDYNENAVKTFLAQAQKGGDWSKSYDQAFGDKVVKRATDKVNFQQYVDGAGDIVLMLLGTEAIGKGVAWAGGKITTKLAPYVPKVLSNLGAKGIMTIGNSTVTVGKVTGNMAASAATFTAWDATKNYINLKTKDIQYTGEDAVKEWQAYKEGNVESGKFGAFAGLLNSTVVGKVVNGTMKMLEKPVVKAMQGVTKTLEKGESSGADVMKTFMAKQTPGMIAQTAGAVAEVAGFTMYETANEITKELLQTDANGQRHLPKDLTEEGLTNYLWNHLKGQAANLGEIKAISKLLFMHKGAIAERDKMMSENLAKCEMLSKVKVQKAEVNGAEIYAITTPNGNRKIARSPEDVVAYCNVLMQMDMATMAKTTAIEANPRGKLTVEEHNVKELIEKAQTTNPAENAKNKVISEVAKDIKDEGMRLNTPESLDAELAEAEQNPNAPVDNLEALNLVINGNIGNVLKAQYDNASNVFKDIAKKYSSELDQLEKQYGNDKKLFAEKFTEFLADKLGVKGIEPEIEFSDTGDADGVFNWPTGKLVVNSKLNNSKDIQSMIAHEFVHVMQFKDMIANKGAKAISNILMHTNNGEFITEKAIELAKKNGVDYKSLPVEDQQIYKEACSEMLADEVMEANKGLVDFAQKNPISKGSLNEYLSRIYQNEYENMKTDVNSSEYYNQVIENEAYYLGNGQLGLNLKGSIHFKDTKTNTPTKNSGVNVPKGVVQSLDAETAKAKIKEHFSNQSSDFEYKGLIECCTADNQPNEVLLNKALLLLDSGLSSYECRSVIRSLKSENGSVDTKAINKFEELIQNGTGAKDIGVTLQVCKDKNGIFSEDLYSKYTSLKHQDYYAKEVLEACKVDGEVVESTWQKALELETLGFTNDKIKQVLNACSIKDLTNRGEKVTGFSDDLYAKAKFLLEKHKFEADNIAAIINGCKNEEGEFLQRRYDCAIKYHGKFEESILPELIQYGDNALNFAYELQNKYNIKPYSLTEIIGSWHTKEDGHILYNSMRSAKSEELISKYNVNPRKVPELIMNSVVDDEFNWKLYNEVVKLHQADFSYMADVIDSCTTKAKSENESSKINYDLLHKAIEWKKLGIDENYVSLYVRIMNEQNFDVNKNDLVKTYHDSGFDPKNIEDFLFANLNLEDLTVEEFRDKVLDLKKQGYDLNKIMQALHTIGCPDGWSKPDYKLTKQNLDMVSKMFDKGVEDPSRFVNFAIENHQLSQEKLNDMYTQAMEGVSADRLSYLGFHVEKPEMKDIISELTKAVRKDCNYHDFASLANIIQGSSVEIANVAVSALKNGAKERDVQELIKFGNSGRVDGKEIIIEKALNALKDHPEKGEEIRNIVADIYGRSSYNTPSSPEILSQKLDLYLNNIDRYNDISEAEYPLGYSGERTRNKIPQTTDLIIQLSKAGVPIDDVLKYTDILCKGSQAYSENFKPEIVAKIVELHNNKKIDKNVLSFIHSLGNTDKVLGTIDYIVNLKDEKALDGFNEQDMSSLAYALGHVVDDSGTRKYKIYDNYKEITDFYIKNKDTIDISSLINEYDRTNNTGDSLNMDVCNAFVEVAKKTGIDSKNLLAFIHNGYADKLPAFVEKIDVKYSKEAKLFMERLSSFYDHSSYSELMSEKMTKQDLDYIFDLQKLISEKNKKGDPTVLSNSLFKMFTVGEKITPEALDKLRYYVEMKLADPKNTNGSLSLYDILPTIKTYKTSPESIESIESLMFDHGLNKNVSNKIIRLISENKDVAAKQVALIEDVVNFASSRLQKDTWLQSSLTDLISSSDSVGSIDAKINVWNTLKSSIEQKSVLARLKDKFNNQDEYISAFRTVADINDANENLVKYALSNDKYRDFVLSHPSNITKTNVALFEDLIMNDKIENPSALEISVILGNTARNNEGVDFVKENFGNLSLECLADASAVVNRTNIPLAKILYCSKDLNISRDNAKKILTSISPDNIDFVTNLCTNKELNFPIELIPDIARVIYSSNVELATKLCNDKNCPKDKIAEMLKSINNISEDIKSLSLSQKINALATLSTTDKSVINLIRQYTSIDVDGKIAELTVALGKKKDIVTIPKAQQKMFLNNILANNNKEAENVLKTFDFEQYEKHGLPLKYSRAEFTANIENIVKDLSPEEQNLVLEHFGLVRGAAGFDGLPNNKPFNNENASAHVHEVAQRVQNEIESFTSKNEVRTGDATVDNVLNGLIDGLPEFTSVVGKEQHGTHAYSVDIHTLKVLQSAMNNPLYENLSDKDKSILKIAALCHDLGKKGGVVDSGHAVISAEYVAGILEKFPFPQSMKDRIIDIVDNHHWFEAYNKGNASAEDVAVRCRRPEDFVIYEILSKADFENVNKDFHIKLSEGVNNQAEFDKFMEGKMKAIDDALTRMYSKANLVFDTQFVKNGENFPKEVINVYGEPTELKVLDLNKLKDSDSLQQYGFSTGVTKGNARFTVHMTNPTLGSMQSVLILTQNSLNQTAWSTSLIKTSNNRTYTGRQLGFVLDVDLSNISEAYYQNTGSGYGKQLKDFERILFDADNEARTYVKDNLVKALSNKGVSLNDKEYAQLAKYLSLKKYTTQITKDVKIGNKIIKAKDLIECIQKSTDALFEGGDIHSEIVPLNPRVKGLVAKVERLEDCPEAFLKFAKDNNLPIILMKPAKEK